MQYKTKYCKNFSLIAATFDKNYDLIKADTLPLKISGDWIEIEKDFTMRNAYFLTLSLEAEGDSDENRGIVSIKKLCATDLPRKIEDFDAAKVDISDVNSWEEFLMSPEIDSKILALGESVHGTETFSNLALSIIKERILKHKCNVVLMELPLESTLSFNRYVKNDPNFHESEMDSIIKPTLLSNSVLCFLNWLKEYNAAHDNVISVFGADYEPILTHSQVELFNFLFTLNKGRIASIDSICKKMIQSDVKIDDIMSLIANNTELPKILTKEELVLTCHCIESWKSKSTAFRIANRDETMQETVRLILKHYLTSTSTATLYMHLGHVGYLTPVQNKMPSAYFQDRISMGQYLKSFYGQKYVCVGLAATKGKTFAAVNHDRANEVLLQDAPEQSLEYQLGKVTHGIGYLNVNKLSDSELYQIRCMGNDFIENQFGCYVPASLMNGMILTENTTPLIKDVTNSVNNPYSIALNRLLEAQQKMKSIE